MKTMYFLLIAPLYIVCISCNGIGPGDKDHGELIGLADTEWTLVAVESLDGDVFPDYYEEKTWEVPEGQPIIIEFAGESGVRGRFDCNWCVGSYNMTLPDSISIFSGSCSREICGKPTLVQDLINSSAIFERRQNALKVYYESEQFGDGVFHFTKK